MKEISYRMRLHLNSAYNEPNVIDAAYSAYDDCQCYQYLAVIHRYSSTSYQQIECSSIVLINIVQS